MGAGAPVASIAWQWDAAAIHLLLHLCPHLFHRRLCQALACSALTSCPHLLLSWLFLVDQNWVAAGFAKFGIHRIEILDTQGVLGPGPGVPAGAQPAGCLAGWEGDCTCLVCPVHTPCQCSSAGRTAGNLHARVRVHTCLPLHGGHHVALANSLHCFVAALRSAGVILSVWNPDASWERDDMLRVVATMGVPTQVGVPHHFLF